MKNLYSILIAIVALVVLVPPSARADTWGEPVDSSVRFTVLASYNFQAVLDNETGLVWERYPDPAARMPWVNAFRYCNTKNVGDRKGWRLPTLPELQSLIDPSQRDPALPFGHPFINVTLNAFRTATSSNEGSNLAWVVRLNEGFVDTALRSLDLWVWCVRGGQGVNPG